MIKYQTEHAVRDYYFSTQRPSTIALAAILNAIEWITPNSYQQKNDVGAHITRIMETYEFVQESIITMCRNRLICLINGCKEEEEVKVMASTSVVEKIMPVDPAPLNLW